MNNRENQPEQQDTAPEKASGQQPDTTTNSRRRILRAGLKAAPVVVATLAARPSLACHCVLPSAWGSINAALPTGKDRDMGLQETEDLVNKFTGSMARYKNSIIENFPSKKFSQFIDNNEGWDALILKLPSATFLSIQGHNWDTNKKRAYLKGKYPTNTAPVAGLTKLTVGQLCQKMGCVTPVGSENAVPINLIRAMGFGGSMLVAQINMYLGVLPIECINKTVLDTMASGTYTAPQTNETWGKTQIASYLHNNWLARKY